MKKLSYISAIILLAASTSSCIEKFNGGLDYSDTDQIVIEGNIVGNSDFYFYVSRTYNIDSVRIGSGKEIDATVRILCSDGSSIESSDQGKGKYFFSVGELSLEKEYCIEVNCDGDTYRSEYGYPLKTSPISDIFFEQPENKGEVSIYASAYTGEGESNYYKWNFDEDWEFQSFYRATIFYDPDSGLIYQDNTSPYYHCWAKDKEENILIGTSDNTQPKNAIQRLASYDSDNIRFVVLYAINVTQRNISAEAFEYYQALQKYTESMGGLFTPMPSEITGNITCINDPEKKAIGFVESNYNKESKRIFIYPSQLSKNAYNPNCARMTEKEAGEIGWDRSTLYAANFRPIGTIDQVQYWVYSVCTDCRLSGTKNKPDFWPNDHE